MRLPPFQGIDQLIELVGDGLHRALRRRTCSPVSGGVKYGEKKNRWPSVRGRLKGAVTDKGDSKLLRVP